MSLLTLALWIAGVIAFVGTGLALLPAGADHPLPIEIITATQTLYTWLYSINNILPVDTLVTVLGYGVLIEIITRIIWPMVFWLIKVITGGGE